MSVNRAEFSVAIKSTFDSTGVDQAKNTHAALAAQLKAMQEDIAQAQRTGVSIPQESIDQVTKLEKAVANFGNVAHESGVKTHEVHEALHLVRDAAGDALGPIGELAHFLGNPYVLAAAGAIGAIKMLVEQHQALREIQLKNIETSRELEHALREAVEQSARDSAAHVRDLAEHFQRLGENVNVATEAMHRFMEANAAALASQQANLTTTNALIAAYIHEQEVLGHVSEPVAHALTERNRNREERQRESLSEQRQRSDIEAQVQRAGGINHERADAEREAQRLQPESNAATAAAKQTAERIKAIQDTIPALEQTAAAAVQDLAEARKVYNDYANNPDLASLAGPAKARMKDLEAKAAAPDAARDAIQHLTDSQARFEQTAKHIDQQIEHQTRIAEQRDSEYRAILETIRAATQALGYAHGDFNRDQPRREEQRRVDRRTELEAKRATGTLTEAEKEELGGMLDVNHSGGINRQTGQYEGPQFDPHTGRPRTATGDLAELARQARELEGRLEHQRPAERNQSDLAQLQRLMNVFSGFMENVNPQVRTLAESLNSVLDRATALQSQVHDNARIVGQLQQRIDARGPM